MSTTDSRTYAANGRMFEIALQGRESGGCAAWYVERVSEDGIAVMIPGMSAFVTSRPDDAFARACARIDRWVHDPRN